MLFLQRQQQIMELLKQRQYVTVDVLCKILYASGATIRRDLAEMESKKMLIRVRGGAVPLDGINHDKSPLMRTQQNYEKKETIARLALKLIHNSTTIFMDSSSTVTALARLLAPFQNLSVMTNGLDTIRELNELTTAKIFDTGGIVKNNSNMVGASTLGTLENFHADVLFFSCCGFSVECGTTEASEDSAAVKKVMCKNAGQRVLLCDSSKFGQEFFCKVCGLDNLTYVYTEKKPEERFCEALGSRLIYPK